MGKSRRESIVYMQRPTRSSRSLSASKNPTKRRRCRDDSSGAWYGLEKAKPVKEHKCNEFNVYIRKPGSNQDVHPMKDLKHGVQENAIIGDFDFEIQEQDKELRRSGEVQERTNSKAERIKCLPLPENDNSLENSVPHPEPIEIPPFPSTMDNSSLKPSLSAEPTSSKSKECDSSAFNSEDADGDEVSQPSAGVKRKKLKLNGELKTHNDKQNLNVDLKNHNTEGTYNKTGECLTLDLKEDFDIINVINNIIDLNVHMNFDQQDGIETSLVDVHLAVNASHRAEDVPFVCLTSKLNGTAILGYPLEIEVLSDGSANLLPRKESASHKLFDDEGSCFHRLVWRTSKRTPVCYVTNSLSASKKDEDSISKDRENGVLVKEKSLMKLLKKPKQFNQGDAGLSRTCVPVELVFSKILAAVGRVRP